MAPLDTWRVARAVLPRRTALRLLGLSVVTTAVAACSGKSIGGAGSIGAVALGTFAAGTWQVSAPGAHYASATITISESGTWNGKFITDPDESPDTSTGTWTLSGKTLHVTTDDSDDGDATGSEVPDTVSGDASAQFGWTYRGYGPTSIKARYDAKAKTLTLTPPSQDPSGRSLHAVTITAVRS